ncbi:MAG: hypothetical protein ACYDHT_00055 [Solirubrobacteraceae bacterium]
MSARSITPRILSAAAACVLLAGCSSQQHSTSATSTAGPTAAASSPPGEAQSAATGDIPDNQTFLSFNDAPAGYTIRYPEGWARQGSGADVTFHNRANAIRVVVATGPSPTPSGAAAAVLALRRSDPTIHVQGPQRQTLGSTSVVKVSYTRLSAADPVTGKRLPITVDRYEYAHAGKVATLDLTTPKGVDNVDAYRMISRSFRWR